MSGTSMIGHAVAYTIVGFTFGGLFGFFIAEPNFTAYDAGYSFGRMEGYDQGVIDGEQRAERTWAPYVALIGVGTLGVLLGGLLGIALYRRLWNNTGARA